MIAALYLRVSTDEQATTGLSLAVQEERCRARAVEDGCAEVTVFRDEGFSGKSLRRPALEALLAKLSEYEAVYVWRLDRLSRKLLDQITLATDFVGQGIRLVSVTEDIDYSTPEGRLHLHLLGSIAEYEVEQLRVRVDAAHRHRLEQGGFLGKPPFGYTFCRDEDGEISPGADIVIVPKEAEVIRELFRRYSRGASLTELAQDLQAREVLGRNGGLSWTSSRLGLLLRSPVYIGRLPYRGDVYEGRHEAVVGPQLWERVQARLEERARIHPRSRQGSLSPLLRCGVCGGHIRRNPGAHSTYLCGTRRNLPPEDRHPPIHCSVAAVHAAIWAWTERLVTGGVLQEAAEEAAERRRALEQSGEHQAVRDELAECEGSIERNLDAYQAGAIDLRLLTSRNTSLLRAREEIRTRLREIAPPELPAHIRRWAVRQTATSLSRLRQGPLGEQREWLARIYTQVELQGRAIVLHHRLPGIPPKRVRLPRYYSPKRGLTDIPLD